MQTCPRLDFCRFSFFAASSYSEVLQISTALILFLLDPCPVSAYLITVLGRGIAEHVSVASQIVPLSVSMLMPCIAQIRTIPILQFPAIAVLYPGRSRTGARSLSCLIASLESAGTYLNLQTYSCYFHFIIPPGNICQVFLLMPHGKCIRKYITVYGYSFPYTAANNGTSNFQLIKLRGILSNAPLLLLTCQ